MNTQQNSPDVVINATNRVPQDIKASSLRTVAQLNNEETDPAAMSLEVSLVTSNEDGKEEEQAKEEVLNKMKNKTSVFDIPNVSSLSLKKKKRHKISKRSVTASSIQDKNLIINVQDVDIKQDEVNGIAAINSDNVSLIKTIKTSLSLTSLPPDEYQEECRDVIKAKLNLERPYNSLKKNADRNLTNQLAQRHARTYERLDGGVGISTGTGTGTGDNCCYGDKDNNNYASNSKLQRCSWYSGHSSSSLHSSAATLGIGSGKDDLWAAIQTNYNYIMDTNLLDTCKEARCEIERATSVLDNQMDKCFKLLDDNQRNEGFCSDPKELRKWLREMEHKIHKAPTLTQATQLSCMELEKHLAEHSILYHEIVSHARVVSACIRAATNKELPHNSRCQQQQQQLIQNPEQQTSLNSTDSSLIAEQTNSSLSSTDETISTATNGGNNNNNNNIKNNSNNNTTTTQSSSSGIGGTIIFDLQKATSSDTASTTSTNTSTSVATPAQQHKKSDNNLERLQNRYHLLYLKAFEVQLWLDGLLRKKTKSPGNTSIEDDLDSEENIDDLTDYECELNEDVDGHKEEKQQYIEAGATEDDFNDVISDLETDITHEQASESLCQDVKQYNHCQQQSLHLVDEDNNLQISTNNRILQHLQIQPQQQQQNCDCKHSKIDYEDGDDEEDEDDDVDDSDNKDVIDGIQWIYNGSRVLKGRSISKQNQPKSSITTTFTPTLTDFEADSESSDLETVKSHMRNYRKHHQVFAHNFIPMKRNNHQQGTNTKKPINCNMNSVWSAVKTLMVNELQQEEHLSQRDIVEVVTSETALTEAATLAKAMPCSGSTTVQNIAEIPVKATVNESNYKQPQKRLEQQPDGKDIAIMSPNNQHHIRANTVSTMLRSQTQQQQKHKQKQQQRKKPIHPSTDISKFNRSNRKSKNCAIFYFRHLDTDNETNCSTTTTSTTNRVEEDIADHNNDDEANYEFDYEYDEVADNDDDDDDDDENDDDDGGCDVIENCIHAAREDSEIYVEGNGVLSSSCCNSHTSDHLKSADASSDDGGWLYSRAPTHVQTKTKVKTITQLAATVGDCLNSNKTRLSIDDNNCCNGSFSLPVNTAESSLTSSTSSSLGSNLGNSTQLSGAVVAIPEVVLTSSICDSDKNSLYIDGDISIHANYNNMTVFNDCSNSSSSSNDMLTEATTATSNSSTHTNVTQILNIDPIQRNGVELQLNNNSIVNNFQYNNNNNKNNNDNHYKLSSYNAMAQFVAVIDHHNDSNNNNNNNDNNNNSNNHDSNNNNRNHCANSSRSIASAVSGVATATNNLHTTLLTETNQRTLSTSSQSLPAMTTAVIAPSLLNDVNGGDITYNANIIGKANARVPTGGHVVTGKLSSNPSNHQRHHHQHHPDYNGYSNQPCTNNNRQQHYQKIMHGQALLHINVGKSLPPRSPAKVHMSNLLTNSNSYTTSPLSPGQVQQNHKVSHECIKQLVLEAEHLVRDEALKTPTKQQQQQQQLQHKHSNNTTNNNTLVQISTTIKKRENVMVGPIKQRVQEWLEHQPTSTPIQQQHQQQRNCHDLMVSVNNGNAGHTPNADDCEASGEASETDSIPQQCSDTSEGFTDSIATCLQTSTNSQGNSTERIGGSAEPIAVHSNQSLNMNMKVIKRQQTRRKSERPWSVSCLSQLTTTTTDSGGQMLRTKKITNSQVQAGLASHSISESALDSLSPRRPRDCTNATIQSHHHHSHHHNHHHHHQHQVKSYDSKNSLKRRKTRKKRLSYSGGKKSDTGSEDYCALNGSAKLSQNLLIQTAETMTNQQLKDITQALLSLQKAASCSTHHLSAQVTNGNNGTANQISALVGNASNANNNNINESEEEPTNLMQPNFRVGSFTTAYMTSEARLGSLAALATYMNDEGQQQGAYTTGPEDQHSSFSETAWDNYQEKYNSENYSEGFDSDAARRLMEFGDDYRNFIDSQSDCCSSLSAANNLESLSPPRMDSLPQQSNETKLITHDAIVSSVDHARRRRALELEYERRRKNLELRRKSCQESSDHHQTTKSAFVISPPTTSHLMVVTAKNTERLSYHHAKVGAETLPRKLEFGMSHSSSQSLRRTSESDTSQRRRKPHDDRRRSSRNLDKCIKVIPATSSSSGDDSDNEKEIRNLLQQSRNRLEDTRALKIRCHLLRPEDYNEIVNTCRDNIRCLESVIRGPSSSVLTTYCINQSKDLLSAWEDLLAWSENAAAARKMQEEMIVLKYALNRLGNKSSFELLDTEPAIQIAIEALKNEKVQLQTYRTSMLKLNASVHSWLTRQEKRLESAVMEQKVKEAATVANSIISGGNNSCTSSSSSNSDGSNMMCADGEKLIEMKEEIVQVQRQQQQQEQHDQQQQQQVNLLKLNNNDNNNLVENNNGRQVTTSTTNTITIIDSNGNQIETHTVAGTNLSNAMSMKQTMSTSTTTTTTATTATSDEEKELDLNTLINSENEFHKHLKNEVSDMYTAWDEADARINSQLEILTSSLIAWRQLESGLCEFQLALGQDRGTLQGLEGALERGQASPGELVQNVKLVAKLLSEKINVSHEQLTAAHDYLDPNHILQIARFTASNGSLSDSGISDGGTTSDGGLSERERRLGMLRRLAKQLESALAPGSDAMKSIAARMESAEAELKSLQNTCRDLIVRTAASQQNKKLLLKEITEYADNEKSRQKSSVTINKGNGHVINNERNRQEQQEQEQQQNNSLEMVKNKRNRRLRRNVATQNITPSSDGVRNNAQTIISQAPDDYDDDPSDDPTAKYELDSSDNEQTGKPRRGWAWRIARVAVPMQLALFTVFCAACLMQPNCCDNINNFSMSFTPQLRYVRGPPPI